MVISGCRHEIQRKLSGHLPSSLTVQYWISRARYDYYSSFIKSLVLLVKFLLLFYITKVRRDPKILLHRFKITFQVGCLLVAIYFTTRFSAQYSENSDEQLLTMKKFNEDTDEHYPTFSFCFKGPRFHWFHDVEIFNLYGINATQYHRLLRGETAERYSRDNLYRAYRKTPVFSNKSERIDFNKFHLKITNILRSLHFEYENPINSIRPLNLKEWKIL